MAINPALHKLYGNVPLKSSFIHRTVFARALFAQWWEHPASEAAEQIYFSVIPTRSGGIPIAPITCAFGDPGRVELPTNGLGKSFRNFVLFVFNWMGCFDCAYLG